MVFHALGINPSWVEHFHQLPAKAGCHANGPIKSNVYVFYHGLYSRRNVWSRVLGFDTMLNAAASPMFLNSV